MTAAMNHDAVNLQALIERSPIACAFVRDAVFEIAGDPLNQLFAHAGDAGVQGLSTRTVAVSEAAHVALAQHVLAAFEAGRPFDDEVEFARRDGSRFWGRLRASPVHWNDPGGLALWFIEDVSEARQRRLQPHWTSIHDPLTELANRREFDRRLADHLGSRRRAPVSVLMLDLDGFADVNALFGAEGGDRALYSIGALLVAKVRASDLVARLDADCFGVLLPACDQHYAQLLADKLRAEIARHRLRWGMKRMRVTARLAVVQLGGALDSPQAVFDAGQRALLDAKLAGGDTVRVAQPAAADASTATAD